MPRWIKRLAIFIVPAILTCEALAATPITIDAIARAVPWIPHERISLLAPVTARIEMPKLEVVDAIRERGVTYIRFRCRPHSDCLPFYVSVDAEVAVQQSLVPVSRAPDRSERPFVRAGNQALLTVQQGPVRLSMPVICLQSGRRGQRVRVRTRENRILTAQVLGVGLLRAGAGEKQ